MAENETSLNDLFKQVRSSQESLDELDSRTDEYKRLLQSLIKTLKQCRDLVDRLAIFSRNEDLDDLSTQDLQYLSIDYHIAEINMRSYDDDRKAQLSGASEHYETFLTRLDEYSMLSSSNSRNLQRYREDRTRFSIAGSAALEAKRNLKVARYQEEKALKSKLNTLQDQSSSLNVDDETIRNLYLAEIDLYVHQTFQQLDLIAQESAILASMPQPTPARSHDPQDSLDDRLNSRQSNGFSERLDARATTNGRGRGAILDSRGRPLQPFTLTDKRTQFRQGVFRPDHSLPTMSIDEYLEEERRRGGIIEGGGNANATQAQPDEDDLRAVDEATMKAREWDEFVEANPKGSGNTINRG